MKINKRGIFTIIACYFAMVFLVSCDTNVDTTKRYFIEKTGTYIKIVEIMQRNQEITSVERSLLNDFEEKKHEGNLNILRSYHEIQSSMDELHLGRVYVERGQTEDGSLFVTYFFNGKLTLDWSEVAIIIFLYKEDVSMRNYLESLDTCEEIKAPGWYFCITVP